MRHSINRRHVVWALLLLIVLLFSPGCAQQRTFATPDLAVDSLVGALRTGDQKQLQDILGPSENALLFSGDSVSDQNSVDEFLASYDQKHALVPLENGAMSLVIGTQDWPMPIPIVKVSGKEVWQFDVAAGMDEIINRRIGRNELDTIQVCLAIVDAQREYAMLDPDHAGLPVYAEKFLSDPGRKNGLYWETKEGEPPSPLGDLMATAEDQGYLLNQATKGHPQPYLGYYYRMLKAQGPNAKGGARDYKVDNHMFDGFAVIAFPAVYGNSGVMTFIVNQDGVVYQRDLGADTAKAAEAITAFDPDANWKKVEPAEPEKP